MITKPQEFIFLSSSSNFFLSTQAARPRI